MRLTVNEQAKKELVELMEARGKYNPTYFINVLISEAYKQHFEIPNPEGSYEQPETTRAA